MIHLGANQTYWLFVDYSESSRKFTDILNGMAAKDKSRSDYDIFFEQIPELPPIFPRFSSFCSDLKT